MYSILVFDIIIINFSPAIFIQVLVHCEQSILKFTAAVHINDTKYVE